MSSAVIESGGEVGVRDDDVARDEVVVHGERVVFATLGDPARVASVWLHGLGSDHTDLLDVARRSGQPALLIDLPGFGRSGRPDRDFPVGCAVEAVLGVLDAAGVRRPLWVGCSYGGHVALRAALDERARVAGLVLVDSGGLLPEPPLHLAAMFDERLMAARPPHAVMAAIDALVARPCDATRRYRARRLASHLAQGLGGALLAGIAPALRAAPVSDYVAVARSARGALQDDTGRRLEAIDLPVEVVHGDRDLLVSVDAARAAAARLRAELTILPGTGHMPWLEAPDQVAARVRRALERTHPTT